MLERRLGWGTFWALHPMSGRVVPSDWVIHWILDASLTSICCIDLGKSLSSPGPQFPQESKEEVKAIISKDRLALP
jgi:hypothetical protein